MSNALTANGVAVACRFALIVAVAATAWAAIAYAVDATAYHEFFGARDPEHRRIWLALLHIAPATLALVAGLLQFSATIRTRWPIAHRLCGMLYCASVCTAATGAALLVPGTLGGGSNAIGFALLNGLWVSTTLLGLRGGLRGNRIAHSDWMLRSYALTLAAVSLRLQMPMLIAGTGWSFEVAYRVVAWSCWLPNLALCELWRLRRLRLTGTQY